MEETVDLRTNVELVRSVSDKHHDLLRPSARNLSRGNNINDMSIYWNAKYIILLFVSKYSIIKLDLLVHND